MTFSRSFFAAGIAALCLLAAPVSAAETVGVKVDNDFHAGGVRFTEAYGDVLVIWDVRNVGGQAMLCGLAEHSKAQTIRFRRTIMRKGWVKADGKKVITDLTYFNDLGVEKKDRPLLGQTASCRPLPAGAGAKSFELGFDRFSIRP